MVYCISINEKIVWKAASYKFEMGFGGVGPVRVPFRLLKLNNEELDLT